MTGQWPVKRKGFFRRERSPQRIQRFTCCHCGRHFSTQTFSTTYWQKRPDLVQRVYLMAVGCMANRQIGRATHCSPSTVAHHIARDGRHCLLFQARELARLPPLDEIVIDGFETFEYSQYAPFHHNLAAHVGSSYLLAHTDSPLRRKGRMTARQKRRRAELEERHGRAHPRSVEQGMRELLEMLAPHFAPTVTIRRDDHRAYPPAIASLSCRVTERVTRSEERRDARNPLFEINALDLNLRHGTAAHKRETIAFAKRRQASIEKLAIFQVWFNYTKPRRVKQGRVTPAMRLGLASRPLRVSDIFKARICFGKVKLPPRWERYYRRETETRLLGVNRTHRLRYAF